MNNFGASLKKARKDARLTLKVLGEKIGKPISYISDIEQGRKQPPSAGIVKEFENALGISEGHLTKIAEKVRSLPKKISNQSKLNPRLSEVLLRADEDLSEEEFEKVMKYINKVKEG